MLAAIPFPDLTPEIFTIRLGGFSFALRWYALAYILGILIGRWILLRLARRAALWGGDGAPYSTTDAEDFLTWAILGVILGGRLGFVLFYQPGHYLAHPLDIPKVWLGGMSFHGGFLGVVAAAILYSRRRGIRLSGLSDALAISIAPGLLLGRIANFVNAELWGRPTGLPWGVIFPGDLAQDCGPLAGACARHPSQLYEAGMEGLVLALLVWLAATRWGWLKQPWRLTGLFLLGGVREGVHTRVGAAVRGSRSSHLQYDRTAVFRARRADRRRPTDGLEGRRQRGIGRGTVGRTASSSYGLSRCRSR
jgi:phosphatidylglycerol:prolipoprotein diacylglycerol transferase